MARLTCLTGKKVLVRCTNAGVFYGILKAHDRGYGIAELTSCRRIWYWEGAASLSQLAAEGVLYPDRCKFAMPIDHIQVAEVVEVIPCTAAASKNIERIPIWKAE